MRRILLPAGERRTEREKGHQNKRSNEASPVGRADPKRFVQIRSKKRRE
jgi:hypothetical protein